MLGRNCPSHCQSMSTETMCKSPRNCSPYCSVSLPAYVATLSQSHPQCPHTATSVKINTSENVSTNGTIQFRQSNASYLIHNQWRHMSIRPHWQWQWMADRPCTIALVKCQQIVSVLINGFRIFLDCSGRMSSSSGVHRVGITANVQCSIDHRFTRLLIQFHCNQAIHSIVGATMLLAIVHDQLFVAVQIN